MINPFVFVCLLMCCMCAALYRIFEQEQELVQLRHELLRKQQQYDALAAAQQQRMQLPQKGLVGRTASSSSHGIYHDIGMYLNEIITSLLQPQMLLTMVPRRPVPVR